MDIGKGTHAAAQATKSLSLPIGKKRVKKLLPTLLCAGLSCATFCETSAHIGMSVNAAAALDGTGSRVKGHHDHDLVILEDSNVEDTYDFDDPSDQLLEGDVGDEEDFDNEKIRNESMPGIIVVAAVDGTLAGISKETGRVLWKQSEDLSRSFSSSSLMKPSTVPSNKIFEGEASQFLKPLLTTTTTTKSASDATYKAVPSVDGTIYTTTNEISMTISVKELVAKTPFLDPQGKFYVGSRYASTAALDGETGQVLRVVSSSAKNTHDDDDDATSLPNLDNHNVIWIGRVDHEVSVQDAKTGLVDAQFSVAEVMSVADMNGIMGKDTLKPEQEHQYDGPSLSSKAVSMASNGGDGQSSTLVATPNGNVALWDFDDGKLAWVANESFDSPIAYAMDATTGTIMGVDIIPDATNPNANIDELIREMERQSESVSLPNTQVYGVMPNGQLYLLPLRRRRRTSTVTATASSGSVAKPRTPTVSQLTGRANTNFYQSDNNSNQQHYQQSNIENNPSLKSGALVTKKSCVPSSPSYPSCLLETNKDQRLLPKLNPALGGGKQQELDGSVAVTTGAINNADGGFFHPKYGYISPQQLAGFYHPDFGYVTPQDLYGPPRRQNKRSDQKIFRVLGSWLPPTIALIFVLSFELGRRKRLKDEKNDQQEFFLTTEQMEKVNGMISSDNKFDIGQRDSEKLRPQEVISVSEEVLGYGGHGTVVYKGVLDGRDVAVKRMLKAYHASADREISLLIESDGHPNVVRYFLKEVRGDFVYLALELCDLSLHELIGVLREKQQDNDISVMSDANESANVLPTESVNASLKILFQIASGVKHLHSLRIVHRDLKPAVSNFASLYKRIVSHLQTYRNFAHHPS